MMLKIGSDRLIRIRTDPNCQQCGQILYMDASDTGDVFKNLFYLFLLFLTLSIFLSLDLKEKSLFFFLKIKGHIDMF